MSKMRLDNHTIRSLKFAVSLIAASVPWAIALPEWNGGLSSDGLLLFAWITSPYLCFFVVTSLLEKYSSIKGIFHIDLVIAVLILTFSLWAYPRAPEESLVYLFAPLWIYIGSAYALGISVLLTRLRGKNS
ncbi:MAG TPA: hypothetical protein VFZ23_02405 [Pyrinomonadaceae bacterium]